MEFEEVMKIILFACVWILLSWYVGYKGKQKGYSFWGPFLLSFVFSPLLTLIVVLCLEDATVKKNTSGAERNEEPVAIDPAKKFVCTRCGTYRSGWYQVCPNCGAEGAMITSKK